MTESVASVWAVVSDGTQGSGPEPQVFTLAWGNLDRIAGGDLPTGPFT